MSLFICLFCTLTCHTNAIRFFTGNCKRSTIKVARGTASAFSAVVPPARHRTARRRRRRCNASKLINSCASILSGDTHASIRSRRTHGGVGEVGASAPRANFAPKKVHGPPAQTLNLSGFSMAALIFQFQCKCFRYIVCQTSAQENAHRHCAIERKHLRRSSICIIRLRRGIGCGVV